MRRNLRHVLVALLALVAAGVWNAAAWADHKPGHESAAAVAQYVEQVPTSSGSKPTGIGKERFRPLPKKTKEKLVQRGGGDAALLEKIATSSAYGAPQRTLRPARVVRPSQPGGRSGRAARGARRFVQRERAVPQEDVSTGKTLSTAVSVVADGSDARLVGLAIVLVAITGVALVAAGYRQRALRTPPG